MRPFREIRGAPERTRVEGGLFSSFDSFWGGRGEEEEGETFPIIFHLHHSVESGRGCSRTRVRTELMSVDGRAFVSWMWGRSGHGPIRRTWSKIKRSWKRCLGEVLGKLSKGSSNEWHTVHTHWQVGEKLLNPTLRNFLSSYVGFPSRKTTSRQTSLQKLFI